MPTQDQPFIIIAIARDICIQSCTNDWFKWSFSFVAWCSFWESNFEVKCVFGKWVESFLSSLISSTSPQTFLLRSYDKHVDYWTIFPVFFIRWANCLRVWSLEWATFIPIRAFVVKWVYSDGLHEGGATTFSTHKHSLYWSHVYWRYTSLPLTFTSIFIWVNINVVSNATWASLFNADIMCAIPWSMENGLVAIWTANSVILYHDIDERLCGPVIV